MGPPAHLKPKHKGKALVAGGISGALEICCTYPIEYTKTFQQLSTEPLSMGNVVSRTLKSAGPLGMYRGLSSMLYFATPKAAIRFGGFETCSSMLVDKDGRDIYGLGKAKGFVAGLGAGTLEAIFVTTPQETIKVKLIHDQFLSETPRFRGFFHGVSTIIREEGLMECYKGLAPTILKVSTAQATRFGIFNAIPHEYRKSPWGAAMCGAFAGGTSVIIFQWIDVVKSRMQGLEASKYKNSVDCFFKILQNEGVAGLYKGVKPRLTRVCCEVAITMSLYGEVVKFLNKIWKTD
uniref:Uncharacterized protein n=1 Tax=Lotharella globosa TaxID=91324 RepID=A0A6U3C197_9EUKA|mmetsp:Transcript_6824/g.13395  ORF Transcript_6824/g.13395 Transcript_6824/m.13395 type:complete len:292 (-) Transcript_6824:338-1213(-)|eukprot:CAMPEP_0167777302 /NCGR_PEP_ID=MMETSP0111_2-20121227/3617_1 /TAXON_ID=91324 /ORGANISM="Lotharella globosa, Strain CCCM811" /LENGTH=291 /DNA_ID=CAMNT_0007667469 /DNA_START=96 /DNA_END=971 /DNA_ORIENTATION=-